MTVNLTTGVRRRLPDRSRDHLMRRQPQRQRQRPLLALGRVGAGRPAFELQHQVVALRADEAHAPAQLVCPGQHERRRQALRSCA